MSPENITPKEQYILGTRYHSERDYESAAVCYHKAAEHGHIKAAYYLGTLYQKGQGVEQSYEEAADWYDLAAEGGDDKAQLALGLLYYNGLGFEKDYYFSTELFRMSADNNNPKAMLYLGLMYMKGQGVSKDYSEAMKLFMNADVQGSPEAMYYIGMLYRDGLGVKKDSHQAAECFRKAVDKGYTKAQKALDDMTDAQTHNNSEKIGSLSVSPETKKKWLQWSLVSVLSVIVFAGLSAGIYFLVSHYWDTIPAEIRAMSKEELNKSLMDSNGFNKEQ